MNLRLIHQQKKHHCMSMCCSKNLWFATKANNRMRGSFSERVDNMSHVNVPGTWSSQFGPVAFTGSNDFLRGHWDQNEGQGQITAGTFNSTTGVLVFSYFQPWNDQRGAAAFLVTATGQFQGNFAQPNGNHGPWNLTRQLIDDN